ncbi:response regulator receiver domain-containing protein [Paucimonas lemoignei]|uniref:Response regulator receiver domain-containing protein n=1 Tax=Paucimonas lemoignei TaxID=29443 RepID=A0A4R3I1U7_PAULE|nr:response regulator [Paucimonas lemoignei]TCS37839.1 response regulator receiver domain-containing protein [Paucimonas lemoignei]
MLVLIVDDDTLTVAMMSRLVSSIENITPVSFTDPWLAIEWCQANEPDMVMVDYQMPQMSGLDFIEAFRNLPGKETIPIVMVTSERDDEIRRKALALTANDFLLKPADIDELKAKINDMLVLRRSLVLNVLMRGSKLGAPQ